MLNCFGEQNFSILTDCMDAEDFYYYWLSSTEIVKKMSTGKVSDKPAVFNLGLSSAAVTNRGS